MISLNGGTLQSHQLAIARSKQDDQHQQTVERQRNESAAFVTRKVGFSLMCSKNFASAPKMVLD